MHTTGTVIFFSPQHECMTGIREQVERSYSVIIAKSMDELSRITIHLPIALFAEPEHVEQPVAQWVERARFFAAGAEIFIIAEPSLLPQALQQELAASVKQGECTVLTPGMIRYNLFFPSLLRVQKVKELETEIASLKNLLGKGVDLKQELDFSTKALNIEKEFSANIISSITSGVLIVDAEGIIVMMNQEAIRICRVQRKDYLAASYKEVLEKQLQKIVTALEREVKETKSRAVRDHMPFGNELMLSWKCYPIYGQGESFLGSLHLIDDITSRENTERQLIQAEKLATMGTMLSGVAHELRNPLSIISGRVQRLLMKKESFNEWSLRYLTSIEEQSARCGHIVNNMLNLARKESAGFDVHDINEILDEALAFIDYQNAFDNIEVKKDYAPHLRVYCDRPQITQAILNLISNAADAMNGRGTLELSTKNDTFNTVIKVCDSGSGIDPKHFTKIFDPFFTTKEAGKGTGLGLPIVYRIVEQHGGTISVHSRPGNTVFTIILPFKQKGVSPGS